MACSDLAKIPLLSAPAELLVYALLSKDAWYGIYNRV